MVAKRLKLATRQKGMTKLMEVISIYLIVFVFLFFNVINVNAKDIFQENVHKSGQWWPYMIDLMLIR